MGSGEIAGIDWPLAPIAHRGLHDRKNGIVENSMSAFGAAIKAGCAIELDLQAAADGEPIVFHDAALLRLTGREGLVREFSGRHLVGLRLAGSRDTVPHLGDVLDLVRGRAPLYIELKTDWQANPQFERRIADILQTYRGPYGLMSFDPKAVRAMQALVPNRPHGLIGCSFADRTWCPRAGTLRRFFMRHMLAARSIRPDFLSYDIEMLPAFTPLALRRLYEIPLLTWTVTTREQYARSRKYGDAMIFENFDPNRLNFSRREPVECAHG